MNEFIIWALFFFVLGIIWTVSIQWMLRELQKEPLI